MRTHLLVTLLGLLLAGCSPGPSRPGDQDQPDDGQATSDDGGIPGDPGDGPEQDGDLGPTDGDPADGGDAEAGDPGDPGSAQAWSWCPSPAEYLGDAWPLTLRIPSSALYCATFDETRTLEQEVARKARLSLVPGDYALPANDGTYTARLPICVELPGGIHGPLLAEPGSLTLRNTQWQGNLVRAYQLTQPMRTQQGEVWELFVLFSTQLPPSDTLIDVLDGNYYPPETTFIDIGLRRDGGVYYAFDSCHFQTAEVQGHHRVEFDGGHIELGVRMGWSGDSTEPAVFWRAAGELDGQAFEQLDYYHLIYNPEHHHFHADFAVLFDEPVGATAGLEVTGVGRFDAGDVHLYTIQTDLQGIEERMVNDVQYTPDTP